MEIFQTSFNSWDTNWAFWKSVNFIKPDPILCAKILSSCFTTSRPWTKSFVWQISIIKHSWGTSSDLTFMPRSNMIEELEAPARVKRGNWPMMLTLTLRALQMRIWLRDDLSAIAQVQLNFGAGSSGKFIAAVPDQPAHDQLGNSSRLLMSR